MIYNIFEAFVYKYVLIVHKHRIDILFAVNLPSKKMLMNTYYFVFLLSKQNFVLLLDNFPLYIFLQTSVEADMSIFSIAAKRGQDF